MAEGWCLRRKKRPAEGAFLKLLFQLLQIAGIKIRKIVPCILKVPLIVCFEQAAVQQVKGILHGKIGGKLGNAMAQVFLVTDIELIVRSLFQLLVASAANPDSR